MTQEQTKLLLERVNRLIDDYRLSCFWFARPDYAVSTCDEALNALRQIERHGTRAMFVRAAEVRQWLSQKINVSSAS
jgi:hypothetical protein